MINISGIKVNGLEEILHFRRSFNSQAKSDSVIVETHDTLSIAGHHWPLITQIDLGPADLGVLSALVVNGDSHSKINRFVTVDLTVTAPRRWWVDMDTYRLGRECDIEMMSDSTMHTISRRLLNETDFDEYTESDSIAIVNRKILLFQEIKAQSGDTEKAFLKIKSNLPEGFLQTRRMLLNYQSCRHIYKDRRNHKQPEFREFCKMIETLPYSKELITV